MELNKLQAFVLLLVLVGMILGVGVLTLDKFGQAAKDSTAVTDETATIASGAGTTTYDEITVSSVIFENATSGEVLVSGNASTDSKFNITTGGVIATSYIDGTDYNISYTYLADSTTTTALSNSVSAITPIASTWLTLIVTIVILAIILTIVIQSFAGKGR